MPNRTEELPLNSSCSSLVRPWGIQKGAEGRGRREGQRDEGRDRWMRGVEGQREGEREGGEREGGERQRGGGMEEESVREGGISE